MKATANGQRRPIFFRYTNRFSINNRSTAQFLALVVRWHDHDDNRQWSTSSWSSVSSSSSSSHRCRQIESAAKSGSTKIQNENCKRTKRTWNNKKMNARLYSHRFVASLFFRCVHRSQFVFHRLFSLSFWSVRTVRSLISDDLNALTLKVISSASTKLQGGKLFDMKTCIWVRKNIDWKRWKWKKEEYFSTCPTEDAKITRARSSFSVNNSLVCLALAQSFGILFYGN